MFEFKYKFSHLRLKDVPSDFSRFRYLKEIIGDLIIKKVHLKIILRI